MKLVALLSIVLAYLFTSVPPCIDAIIEIKLGVVLVDEHGAPYDLKRCGAAVELAVEEVNKELLAPSHKLVPIIRSFGPECDPMQAAGWCRDKV